LGTALVLATELVLITLPPWGPKCFSASWILEAAIPPF
jgi:hypothetical protein